MFERKDSFYRRAKAEGYRSRAAYKLLELNTRFRLIRKGDTVLDLGSAPGGWLQVAQELVGESGRVIGVDLLPISPLGKGSVAVITGDFREERVQEAILGELGGRRADVILSDLSPRLTGIKQTDDARAIELARDVLRLLGVLLEPKGSLLLKSFVGPEFSELSGEFGVRFRTFRKTRPEATRKSSSEIYLIGIGYRGEG